MRYPAIWIPLVALWVGVVPAEPLASMTAWGEVISVDTAAKTLSVRVEENQAQDDGVTFVVDSQTRILIGNGPIQLPGIKPGDRVTVVYRDLAGRNVASRIGVHRKHG